MPRKRLFLIAIIVLAALAGIALSPALVTRAIRGWLYWQARRQHLKIEIGKINAPFLRPVSIDHIRVTNEATVATQIELNVEHPTLRLNLARLISGKTDGVRGLSVQNARVEVRRDFSGSKRPLDFNWGALQALLPVNFEISRLDLRVENGPTVVLLRNASISGNQIESGRFSADEVAITSPMFRQTFSQLRGATKWQESRLTIGGLNLARGLDLESLLIDLSRLDGERADLQFDLDVLGGKIRASISNEWAGQHSIWNLAGTATGISLAQTSEVFGFTDRLGGSLRACNFTFRGDPRDPLSGTASIWTELNGLSWHNRAADLIMLGAVYYNRQIQLQQLYIKQRQNQLTMNGDGALPSKSADWLNPDFRGQISGSISDLGQFAELFGATRGDFAGVIAIEGTLNARERKLGGHLTASGNSLSLFKRQIDRLSAKITLKASELELEQFEVARKKDFVRAQGTIDISHEQDYSGNIDAKVGDASEYFLLGRTASGAATPVQLEAKISSGQWNAHAAFTLPGSSQVDVTAKFPFKIGEDWKEFLASPLDAQISFPTVVLASAPQLFHPPVFNEGILSGAISWSQTLQHPNISGELQLLNSRLQNAPMDFTQATARITFDGEHGKIEFLNATTADVDVSLRGDIEVRDLAAAKIDIFPSMPVFELTTPPNSCVNRINLQPIGITLAPMINQIELRGSVFEGGWTMTSRQAVISAQGQPIPTDATKIPLCFGEKPAQQTFTFGLHPKPTPVPERPRKKSKRR
ncbi:MAG TPA: hypothetical protein VNX27_04380 [Chthoniobacterales bacterium]|jgi:hypothetical protein|nr:hypothetical protein [Chthoniobacterales bacterium]